MKTKSTLLTPCGTFVLQGKRASSLYTTCSAFPTSPGGGIHKRCPWNQYPVLQAQLQFEKSFTQMLYVYSIHAIDHWAINDAFLPLLSLLAAKRVALPSEKAAWRRRRRRRWLCWLCHCWRWRRRWRSMAFARASRWGGTQSMFMSHMFNPWIVLFPLQFPLLDNFPNPTFSQKLNYESSISTERDCIKHSTAHTILYTWVGWCKAAASRAQTSLARSRRPPTLAEESSRKKISHPWYGEEEALVCLSPGGSWFKTVLNKKVTVWHAMKLCYHLSPSLLN